MSEVTVADLIRFLERQDPEALVRTMDYDQGVTQEILEYWFDREQNAVIIG